MFKNLFLSLLFSAGAKVFGQQQNRLIHYHLGFNITYVKNYPDFTLPVGIGIIGTATLDKFAKLKPTLELNAIGFPEFKLFGNNSRDEQHYDYGIYTFLLGAKFKLTNFFRISLIMGPTFISTDEKLTWGFKPAIELNPGRDKFLIHLYYLQLFGSSNIENVIGTSFLFKLR